MLLLAAATLHFDVTDARGKKASGVTIESSPPDPDGWSQLKIAKSKAPSTLVWPFDAAAKIPDGPEPVPVIVIENGAKISSTRTIAAMAAGELLGAAHPPTPDTSVLASATDPFERGVGLLYAKKAEEAVAPLAQALHDRERQLTRIPSEIFAAAMLYGMALHDAGKPDDAAVAFRKALQQRPSDPAARKARSEALSQGRQTGRRAALNYRERAPASAVCCAAAVWYSS